MKKKLKIINLLIILSLVTIPILALVMFSTVPKIEYEEEDYDSVDCKKEEYDDLEFYTLTHDEDGQLNEYGKSLT